MQRRRYLMRYVSEDEPAGVIQFSALLNVRFWHKAAKLTGVDIQYIREKNC
ncbi:hypothetical protein L466_03615 [Enterobacter sp. BIDMC 30]|nr:hypothetical protein L466_03615 [Enterobacter sp. BIDMC 30]